MLKRDGARGSIKTENVGLAGAGATVLVWICYELGVEMPPEVAAAFVVLSVATVSLFKGS